ncbi:zinc knuckle, partial [Ostertagia ostertagi]
MSSPTTLLQNLRIAETKVKSAYNSLERSFYAFTSTVDGLETPLNEEEESKVSEYVSKTEDVMAQANGILLQIEGKKEELGIIAQLEAKGQNLDNPWLMTKILSKFTEDLQRRVLKEKVSDDTSWNLRRQMHCLDMVLKQEEKIELQLPKKPEMKMPDSSKKGYGRTKETRNSKFCFYCDEKDHWSTHCTAIKDPRKRLQHLKDTNRCTGCGSRSHMLAECKSKGCQKCGKKHHTSTCFKGEASSFERSKLKGDDAKKKTASARHNVVVCSEEENPRVQESSTESSEENHTVLTVKRSATRDENHEGGNIFLLSGTLRTKLPQSDEFIGLTVLLDTGADRSFIDETLVHDLELPQQGSVRMKLCTFGSQKPTTVKCIRTRLTMWDVCGKQHDLNLYAHKALTQGNAQGVLDTEDLKFIKEKRIRLSLPPQGNVGPSLGHHRMRSVVEIYQIGSVDTKQNLADCATRGLSSSEFSNHDWWKGHTLKEIQNNGFKLYTIQEEDGEPETVVTNYVKAIANEDETVKEIVELSAYNELRKVRRIVAYALRFLKGIHSRLQGALKEKLQTSLPWIARKVESQSLSATETKDAELILIKQHQAAHLQSQYRKELVKNLNVREDKNKILRAYGRLNKADLDADAKNPIVIAPKSEI